MPTFPHTPSRTHLPTHTFPYAHVWCTHRQKKEATALTDDPRRLPPEQHLAHLGSDISPHYRPHTLLNHPPSPADVTLELLLASQAHQGHATSLWNPANARYIEGIRHGVHIISLDATAAHLRRCAKVVQEVCFRAGMVLFVGTRPNQDRAVVRAARAY